MKKILSPLQVIATLVLLATPVMFMGCSADGLMGADMQGDAPEVTATSDLGPSLNTTDPDAEPNTP